MDDFMVDWFGLDRVDDMSGNPHDEGANANDPCHQQLPRDNGSGKRRRHMLEHLFFRVQG
jgi:hypothetical protein